MSNAACAMATRHVPPSGRSPRRILGIDLGGALQYTTGYALVEEDRLLEAGLLTKSTDADHAEQRLLELLERFRPTIVAVDAPLTLPPCLTCPSYCRGPDSRYCELESAKRVWAAGGNPVTERLCEVLLRSELKRGKPLPTMRIAQIAARGVALARRLTALRMAWAPWGGPELLEVYPYATLIRLGQARAALAPQRGGEAGQVFRDRILDELSSDIEGLEDRSRFEDKDDHVLDALVAAYTAWLGPDRLEHPRPNEDFNIASGWIWLPKPGTI